jgi:hypothetical protein
VDPAKNGGGRSKRAKGAVGGFIQMCEGKEPVRKSNRDGRK